MKAIPYEVYFFACPVPCPVYRLNNELNRRNGPSDAPELQKVRFTSMEGEVFPTMCLRPVTQLYVDTRLCVCVFDASVLLLDHSTYLAS